MEDCQDLSNFKRGIIVGLWERRHSISKVKFVFFLCSFFFCVVNIGHLIKLQISGIALGRKRQWRNRTILIWDRYASLSQIAKDINTGESTSVSVQNVQWTVIDMGFQGQKPFCRLHATKCYTMPGLVNTAIRLLMTGHRLSGLMSLFNCIRQMDMYVYEENLMNPWSLYVNKGLCKLVKVLSWIGPVQLVWYRTSNTPTGDGYISILSDHLCPFMSFVHSNRLGRPTHRELLQSDSRNTLPPLGTSPNMNILSISGKPCNVLFRRDLHSFSFGCDSQLCLIKKSFWWWFFLTLHWQLTWGVAIRDETGSNGSRAQAPSFHLVLGLGIKLIFFSMKNTGQK